MVFEDAFDLHPSDLDPRPLRVTFQTSDSPGQYHLSNAHSIRQPWFIALPLSTVQALEVPAQIVRLPVCDGDTVRDVGDEDGGGKQPPESGDNHGCDVRLRSHHHFYLPASLLTDTYHRVHNLHTTRAATVQLTTGTAQQRGTRSE